MAHKFSNSHDPSDNKDEHPGIPPVPWVYEHPLYDFDGLIAMRSTTLPTILLGKLLQSLRISSPSYTVSETGNPRRFLCDVTIGGKCTFPSCNPAKTVRAALENAAGKALNFLFRCPSAFYNEERALTYDMLPLLSSGMLSTPAKAPSTPSEVPSIPSEIPLGSYILALRELCRLNGYRKLIYAFEDTLYEDEQRCRVSIITGKGVLELWYGATFRTKRDAKKDAAMAMFLELKRLAEEAAAGGKGW
jgi:hypothetical protein